MRIAIINDMPIAVEAIKQCLKKEPTLQICWVAADGAEAVTNCARDLPDLVLMDLIMPVMDGVEATRRIMLGSPCPILVVTSCMSANLSKVFDAMSSGALDVVNTPVPGGDGCGQLLAKIALIGKLIGPGPGAPAFEAPGQNPSALPVPFLIALGASTGGPQAVAEALSLIPADCTAAIVIIQHVDKYFTQGFASWLGEKTSIPVELAREGERPRVGSALLACTNDHLVIAPDRTLRYTPEPKDYFFRPSVDVFFNSLAANWPAAGAAVLLTGMGRDGAAGLLSLRRKGWHTVAQDKATSLVYGMPKAAAELNAAKEILPLAGIALYLRAVSK